LKAWAVASHKQGHTGGLGVSKTPAHP